MLELLLYSLPEYHSVAYELFSFIKSCGFCPELQIFYCFSNVCRGSDCCGEWFWCWQFVLWKI